MIGETIGNFRVTSKLGAGGMGEVFLAEQTSIGTMVAIKVLRPEISVDRQHVDRFFNEARAVGRIKHAGTVKIFDVGFHNGSAYLVMEFLEGETLAARSQRLRAMPLSQISDIGKQACGVLEATHAAGITHRDLKPDNIFLCPDSELGSGERVKILDFGIAKLSGSTAAGGPRTVGTMGTPAYMAPEQWGDAAKVDWRADIYSLGCVLFEMATSRPPFVAENFAQACGMHLSQQPPKLRSLIQLPESLETLIDNMLAKSPYSRPPLRDVAKLLGELASTPGASVSSPLLQLGPMPEQVAATMAADAPTHGAAVHQPTPVNHQTPRHPTPEHPPVAVTMPVARPVTVPEPPVQPQNTTLSSAAGATEQLAPKKSRAPLYAIGGIVVVGGIITAVAVGGGGNGKTKVATTADAAASPPPVEDAAVAVADTAVSPPPIPEWTKPPFVDIAGMQVMKGQATRGTYKAYLASLAKTDQPKATPLKDWSDERAAEPVGWVTYEQAAAFCQAADATLLTKEQWMAAAGGSWRIGTAVPGELVFRDWTSTVTADGLAVVLGGTSKMANDAARMAAVKNPLSKPTEASAGASPPPETVASGTIGIRCVRGTVSPVKQPAEKSAPPATPPSNRGSMTLGQPNAQGDLDKDIIRRYIRQNIQKIQDCYDKELVSNPTLSGTVQTQFFIGPDGAVKSASGNGVSGEVASCVANVIKGIRFPEPKGGGGVQVNYPFTFRPLQATTPPPTPSNPTPTTGPVKPPEPAKQLTCDDAAALDAERAAADAAYANGSYARSLAMFERLLPCRPALVSFAYLAACRARSFAKAKTYYARLDKESYAQICMKEGFDPRK